MDMSDAHEHNGHHEHQQTLTRCQRAADIMHNGMGSCLSSAFSLPSCFCGVILLIAAKRQDEPHRLLFRPAIRPATENLSTPVAGIPLPESMSDRSGFAPNGQDRCAERPGSLSRRARIGIRRNL
jgi:hypothetical protein